MSPWFKKNKSFYSSKKKLSIKTKGLLNEPGENNCFLNSAVQVLWHLDVFRTNFARFTGHNCAGENSCIFCAMKHLFARFKYSDQEILPPTDLRVALAIMYQAQKRFQLGLMDDAAECFENLLIQIHSHIVETNPADKDGICSAKHCISHQKFGMMIIEQGVCQCGETSEPLPFIQLVHYVSATALCAKVKARKKNHLVVDPERTFGRLIRSAGNLGGCRDCPSNCGSQIETRASLMNAPDVISIGVNWDSEEPDIQHIVDLVSTLNTNIKVQDMFDAVLDKKAQKNEYHLSAVVCYYGKHYSTFFHNRKLNRWVSIDDATVTEVGKHWRDVIHKCIKGHYQPLLLLYTNYNAEPISLSTAPPSIKKISSSVASSPALSRYDSEVASSCSSGSSISPSHVTVPNGAASGTKPKKLFQWNAPSSRGSGMGHYKEPSAVTPFTVYKPYATPTAGEKNRTLQIQSNGNAKNPKAFPTL